LVTNSETLDDLERRNSPNRSVISLNSVAFGADYVKVIENTPILSAAARYSVRIGCRGTLGPRGLCCRSKRFKDFEQGSVENDVSVTMSLCTKVV